MAPRVPARPPDSAPSGPGTADKAVENLSDAQIVSLLADGRFEDSPSPGYTNTLMRVAPYLAGMAAAVAVNQHATDPYSHPGPRGRALLDATAWAVMLWNLLIGAEPMYFMQMSSLGQRYYAELPSLCLWNAVMARPLVGLAVAYLLATATTGHAPRLAAVLSLRLWRPLAVLSYSMYLLQYVGSLAWDVVFDRFIAPRLDTDGATFLTGLLVAHAKFPAVIAGTLPLALANYALVERPLTKFGHALSTRECVAGGGGQSQALV